MVMLDHIVAWCDERTRRAAFQDFPGAENGLQLENNGEVTKIGAAVDAGEVPFARAIEAGVDFLLVHHGMFWSPVVPLTGRHYRKIRHAMEGNLAVYGSHLPLDAHPEIGNNAQLAAALGFAADEFFLPHAGEMMGLIARANCTRPGLATRLQRLFPRVISIEKGSERLERVAILTGSGRSALPHLTAHGVDTLITGELRQEHFNLAEEMGFNLYCCGHYATEVFGVKALAAEVAGRFGLEWEFIATDCPL